MKKFLLIAFAIAFANVSYTQSLKTVDNFKKDTPEKVELKLGDRIPLTRQMPKQRSVTYQTQALPSKLFIQYNDAKDANLIAIKSSKAEALKNISKEDQVQLVLEMIKQGDDGKSIDLELNLIAKESSITGEHLSYTQSVQGVPVFGSELKIHVNSGEVLALGRIQKNINVAETSPALSSHKAFSIALQNFKAQHEWVDLNEEQLKFVPNANQSSSELVIFGNDEHEHRLCYHHQLYPNLRHRWEVFQDANTGEVFHSFASHCQLWHGPNGKSDHANCGDHSHDMVNENAVDNPGPVTAVAQDLFNINRTINVYEEGGLYYMIDASRNMFNNGLSNFPDDPKGTIWTLDAQNGSPENSNFQVQHVGSTNNTWTDKSSVSAHYNGGVAYEYFRTTHGRNSINGSGGNIISLINVAESDGSAMDNAFWNGAAMFYGNGNQAFNAPLAKGLDVAGHELSHGVVQNEANLTYQNQSGALNESFADIFGAMIDRDDWDIGEDISNPAVFPSGAMRSMQDPNNGGNSNNFYWQPKHMDEFRNLPNTQSGDWGGVHINSGIPNHAYYLFATASGVGKDKAEKIYYEVLANYLVASSEFIDLRIAVMSVAESMYGPTVKAAAENAFSQVGIGPGQGNDFQQDNETNPGDEIILWATGNSMGFLFDNGDIQTITNTGQASRPSITDDGNTIVFIDDQNRIVVLDIDYTSGGVDEFYLENPPQTIWRNIAISKDGSKLALLTTAEVNEIFVYDFDSQDGETFILENPTTSNPNTGQVVNTGDVKYADVLEWDITGEFVMYDALNELSSDWSGDITYWDIGLLNVWDSNLNDFSNGAITKLFTGLQENESVGNPSFAKDSPYIIAFDYLSEDFFGNTDYSILGSNLETGDIGLIYENNSPGYPSYSPSDEELLFSAFNSYGDDLLATIPLAGDKISAGGDPVGLVADPIWGVWFANGERPLVNTFEPEQNHDWDISPNPASEEFVIQWNEEWNGDLGIRIYDNMGRLLHTEEMTASRYEVERLNLVAGHYHIVISKDAKVLGLKSIILQ